MKAASGTPRKALTLLAAFLLLALLMLLPLPEGLRQSGEAVLTYEGRVSLAVLLFCLLLWVTEPLPFHITGLLALVLLALLKADTFPNLVRYGFGNETIIFFIGVLTMSACIGRSGLGRRIYLLVLRVTGNSTRLILLGTLLVGALLAMWVTTVAATAIMMPLVDSLAGDEELKPGGSRFGKGLYIAASWGCLIGGTATPAGSGANPIAIGFIRDLLGVEVSFLDWMAFGVPCMLALLLPAWGLLLAFFPPENARLRMSAGDLRDKSGSLPPLNRDERAALFILLFVIALWLLGKPLEALLKMRIPTALPALLGACLFFVPGLSGITWKQVQEDISWSGILLIASGISLGMLLYQTGAASWLAAVTMGGVSSLHPLLQIFLVIIMVAVLKLGLSSNSVTATVVIPIVIGLSQPGGHPLMLVIPAAMTMNAAYTLVTSSPSTVITYAAGHYTIADLARSGAAFTLVSALVMTGVIYLIGSLAGIY